MVSAMPQGRGGWMGGVSSSAYLLSVLILLAHAGLSLADTDDVDDNNPATSSDKCTLYLAPSSIPNAGLGTYTTITLSPRQQIGPAEPLINVLDLPFHTSPDESNSALLADYDWSGEDYLAHLQARKVQTMIPGMGAAINSHPGLYNVVAGHPTINSSGLRRYSESVPDKNVPGDAGSGAVTYYHSLRSLAAQTLEAGSELFAHYSDPYFLDRTSDFGMIPLAQDFEDADEIVPKFHRSMETDETGLTEEAFGDLWTAIRTNFGEDVRSVRLMAALPETLDDVKTAAAIGKSGSAHLSLPSHVRSPEWLEEHGMCVDTVQPGLSSIPQAGRGGFAVRDIPEGDVVLPLPLLQINRTLLDMRSLRKDPDHDGRLLKSKDVVGKQLLFNYCFGHSDSSVLLFPYSTGSANINHAGGDREANVKLRWHVPSNSVGGGDGDEEEGISGFHHPDWLELDAPGLMSNMKTGLLMELVATKPIARDEEILLHYGPGWTSAWAEHVNTWSEHGPHGAAGAADPELAAEPYQYPHVLDDDKYAPLKTHAEAKDDPYPPNVATACFYNAPTEHGPVNPSATRRTVTNHSDPNGRSVEAIEMPWDGRGLSELAHPTLRPCRIISREERVNKRQGAGSGERMDLKTTELVYTALMRSWNDDIPSTERHVVYDIPRDGIRLMDRAYSSDQHLRGAFRREIGVPDDVFPVAWRDLA